MTCNGCGNPQARRTRTTQHGETCDGCGGLRALKRGKKTGFMFGGKLLGDRSNAALARQVRQDYLGTEHDEHRGRDYA